MIDTNYRGFINLNNKEYHDDRNFLSSSGLKLMFKNPRLFYKTYVENSEPNNGSNSAAFEFGSYVHSLILEPHLTDEEFAIFDGMRRGKAWDEFKALNENKTIIGKKQAEDANELVNNFKNTSIFVGSPENEKEVSLSSFFSNGKAEESLMHEIDNLPVKVRFDYRKEWETHGSIYDLKTSSEYCDDIEKVEKICSMYSYDISAALYVDCASQFTGKVHDFYFVFMSKADNQSYMYKASEQMIEEGRRKYKEAIKKLHEARSTGIYYRNRIQELRGV